MTFKADFDSAMAATWSTGVTYRQRFDTIAASADGDTDKYWLKIPLDAMVSMYEATLDMAYADVAMGWCEAAIAAATITDSDGYKNWSGSNETSGVSVTNQNPELRFASAMARWAFVVSKSAVLQARYGSRYTALNTFLRVQIGEKLFFRRDDYQGYGAAWRWYFDTSTGAMLYDTWALYCWIGRFLAYLGGAQPTAAYGSTTLYTTLRDVVIAQLNSRMTVFGMNGATILDANLVPNETYRYGTPPPLRKGNLADTNHASALVDCYLAYAETGVISAEVVRGLAWLFAAHIWDGDAVTPEFANFISGWDEAWTSEGTNYGTKMGQVFDGWVRLGAYLREVQTACSALHTAIKAGETYSSAAANNWLYGKVSLPAHLAFNEARPPATPQSKRRIVALMMEF